MENEKAHTDDDRHTLCQGQKDRQTRCLFKSSVPSSSWALPASAGLLLTSGISAKSFVARRRKRGHHQRAEWHCACASYVMRE
jgi:hypothetical protein